MKDIRFSINMNISVDELDFIIQIRIPVIIAKIQVQSG